MLESLVGIGVTIVGISVIFIIGESLYYIWKLFTQEDE